VRASGSSVSVRFSAGTIGVGFVAQNALEYGCSEPLSNPHPCFTPSAVAELGPKPTLRGRSTSNSNRSKMASMSRSGLAGLASSAM
jgi:hypothetical protein